MRFLLLLFILFSLNANSQIDLIKGTSSIEWPTNISEDAIKKSAKEKAILNGIEKKYGQVVIQGNSTYIKNLNDGNLTESQSVFYSTAQTLVKGEFLRQIGVETYHVYEEKIKTKKGKEKVRFINCEISFEAKEVGEKKALFSCFPTACEEKPLHCKTSTFYNGDNFYLYLKSPVSGYFTVYSDFEYEGNHYCSRYLPVLENGSSFEGGLPIKAETAYLLFSKSLNNLIKDFRSQEMIMVTNEPIETMRLFFIYSEKPIIGPILSEIPVLEKINYKDKNLVLPKGIRSEKFQSWLYEQRAFNQNFSHQVLDVTIHKFKE